MFIFYFKQFPLNIKQSFELSYQLFDGETLLLSVVVGVVNFSSDKVFFSNFHDTSYNKVVEILSNFKIHHY